MRVTTQTNNGPVSELLHWIEHVSTTAWLEKQQAACLNGEPCWTRAEDRERCNLKPCQTFNRHHHQTPYYATHLGTLDVHTQWQSSRGFSSHGISGVFPII